jgi:hypothetical protein
MIKQVRRDGLMVQCLIVVNGIRPLVTQENMIDTVCLLVEETRQKQ